MSVVVVEVWLFVDANPVLDSQCTIHRMILYRVGVIEDGAGAERRLVCALEDIIEGTR